MASSVDFLGVRVFGSGHSEEQIMGKRVSFFVAWVVTLSLVALSSSVSWGAGEGVGAADALSIYCRDALPEVYIGDFDEDGRDDLGLFWPDNNTFHVSLSTGKRFGDEGSGQWVGPGAFGHSGGQYYVGDFDGDDRDDLGFFDPNNSSFHVSLSTGSSFAGTGSGRWLDPLEFGNANGRYYVAYFNGGKKADLGFFYPANNTFWVTLSTGSGFEMPKNNPWIKSNEFGNANGKYYTGDFTEDGTEDLGFFEPANNSFYISMSDGEDFGQAGSGQWIAPNTFGHAGGQYYIGDYDGDGDADLGFFEPADNTFWVALSNRREFPPDRRQRWVDPNELGHAGGQYFVGDFNGGGKDDLGFYDPTNGTFYVGLSTASGFDFTGSGVWANLRMCRSYLPMMVRRR
jgi:hypothetical protein